MAKVTKVENTKVIDTETGAVLQETTATSFNYGKEPDYIKVYLDNIIVLAEISGWVSKVLYELVKTVSYANKGQYIIINAGYKRILAEQLNIKPQSITNAINQLIKATILMKKENGVFQLNPQFFGRGDWKDIAKIRYEVELNSFGKTVKLKETERKDKNVVPFERKIEGE